MPLCPSAHVLITLSHPFTLLHHRYKLYYDEDDILNKFRMLWDLRKEFPVHFTVFKQCASHLHHQANVEQIFSLAGRLSDPNLDPHLLPTLVRFHFNKKTFMPSKQAIRERYYRKYHKAGPSHDKEDEVESDATAEASTD